ncbi:unnamed protein product [Hyaloperonospora brassicae]|uniref:Serine hydrolase domain-containing protein n=1 Tax=Hyaloperonospora brassicae TaxID=162125 RepID=A0AAV0UHK3_HYABA|nr:unnamed protein product [Hyaloperonospora brassicae]
MKTAGRALDRDTGRKLRLLCLHGMYQDASTFAVKMNPLRGVRATANVDFVFLDGPFAVVPPILTRPGRRLSKRPSELFAASSQRAHVRRKEQTKTTETKKMETEYRAWRRPLGSNEEVDPSRLARDWDVLVGFLREQIDEIGDVDGVLGFSQGASLAAWMCSERARAELQWSPKVAVLIGSYVGSPPLSLDSGVISDISSLHIFGSNDGVVPPAKSQQVVDIFKQHTTLGNRVRTSMHAQGHVIPKCDVSKQLFESFLTRQQLSLLGSSSVSSVIADGNDANSLEAIESEQHCSSSSPALRWSPRCSHVCFPSPA